MSKMDERLEKIIELYSQCDERGKGEILYVSEIAAKMSMHDLQAIEEGKKSLTEKANDTWSEFLKKHANPYFTK
ncbi:MAG: hypothetical protein J5493_02815 [Lachnospiraceae bacterium]|nr:hypothetical protein [Lachnospiraceae bacterium]